MKTENKNRQNITVSAQKTSQDRIAKDLRRNKTLYLLVMPVIIWYIIFCYIPMYGAVISFKEYSPAAGILGSPWVGLKYFREFFGSPYFVRTLRNTLVISITLLIFSFPAPIILALLINELKSQLYSRTIQTVTYLPHFISLVVVCSMIKEFTASDGIVTQFLGLFGFPQDSMLINPSLFVPVYVVSEIWQEIGWGSVIYLAALTGVDQQLYEAAMIDGANRWKQLLHVTLPCIIPTIITMLILRIGNIMSVGYEKIILLYNSSIYETSDVLSSFVYRKGLLERNYSYSAAAGLFNSVINCLLLVISNKFSRKLSRTSLW